MSKDLSKEVLYDLHKKLYNKNEEYTNLFDSIVVEHNSTKPIKGICVDGGTEGNPGPCFYRGVDIETNKILFEKHLGEGTNNIAEFLAIVHAIHYCEKNNIEVNIWSDSKTAITWVRNKKVNTSVNGPITDRLAKACEYIKNKDILIHKWETKHWGEIPADFGRK
jgi:ribonuclease HI